jgi:hypothetical protein
MAFIVCWAAVESVQKSPLSVSLSSSDSLTFFCSKSKTLQEFVRQFLGVRQAIQQVLHSSSALKKIPGSNPRADLPRDTKLIDE